MCWHAPRQQYSLVTILPRQANAEDQMKQGTAIVLEPSSCPAMNRDQRGINHDERCQEVDGTCTTDDKKASRGLDGAKFGSRDGQ
jgi:hypothetical protein